MSSETEICNGGLQILGAARIQSLTEANKNARACNANYFRLRDVELRKHRWGFSIKRVQLAKNTTDPVFGKTNYFELPSDCLRILPPPQLDVDWVIEEAEGKRAIATDWTAPLDLRYVAQVTDPNLMDATFRDALSARIALELCEEITQSNKKQETSQNRYDEAMAEAKRMNAIESVSFIPPEDEWITVRTDGIGNLRADNPYT